MEMIDKLSCVSGEGVVTLIRGELLAVSADDASFQAKLEGPIYEDNIGVTRFVLCARNCSPLFGGLTIGGMKVRLDRVTVGLVHRIL